MKVIGVLLLSCFAVGGMAEDSFELWMTALSARGRIEVMAADAVMVQKLAFWGERSLKQLEKNWKTVVPFQAGHPLSIVIDPNVNGVTLQQNWERGALKQKLWLSESAMKEHPRELAEVFTRAMGFRVGLAAMPPDKKEFEWQVPEWLVTGSAHALLAERSHFLFEVAVREYAQSSPPYPELISDDPAGGSSGLKEAGAALLCLWLFQLPGPQNVWSAISQGNFRESDIWVELLPGVGNLRQVHQHWDVWWQAERNRLITEYAMDEEARKRLEEEVVFLPAFYGLWIEDQNRYQRVDFAGLEPYLDDPRFGVAMQEWIVRLQRLRFRQSPEFNQEVEQLQQAGRLAILAANAEGRKRERLWAEAVGMIPK